jgi:hypothetical protein
MNASALLAVARDPRFSWLTPLSELIAAPDPDTAFGGRHLQLPQVRQRDVPIGATLGAEQNLFGNALTVR